MNDLLPPSAKSSPFVRSEIPTVAEIIERLNMDTTLGATMRRDLISALRTLARMVGLPVQALPANVRWLNQKLRRVHPATFGMSPKRFANIKADAMRAFEHTGVAKPRASYFSPLSDAWVRLWRGIEEERTRRNLSRLSHFCSAIEVAPTDVDDTVIAAFLEAIEAERFLTGPRQIVQTSIKTWNRAAALVPDWPGRRLTELPTHQGWTLPLDKFCPSFRADLAAWLDRLAGTDPLAADGPARPLRPTTVDFRRFQLRMFASAVVLGGTPIEEIADLTDLVGPTRLKAGLRYLLDRNGGQPNRALPGLVQTLRSVIRHWAALEPTDIEASLKLCAKFRTRDRTMGERSRRRLRQFDDPSALPRFLLLPQALRSRVLAAGPPSRKGAVELQLSVAIELLTMCPIRVANLATLEIGRHLIWRPPGTKRDFSLVIPAEETKNGVAYEASLPRESVALIRLYLERYHPLLTPESSPWLFPGENGRPKRPSNLSMQIKHTILAKTGIDMSAHAFRHLAAKVHLEAHPGSYEGVRRLLGHRDMDTTARFYAGLEASGAIRHYDRTVLDLRRSAGRPRSKKPG